MNEGGCGGENQYRNDGTNRVKELGRVGMTDGVTKI